MIVHIISFYIGTCCQIFKIHCVSRKLSNVLVSFHGTFPFQYSSVANEDDRKTLDLSLCECADWCKSLGKGYVHVMYVPDEKQCHCQRGVAKRGEERSDTLYYVLE